MCSNAALEITSCGPAGDCQGNSMGKFDLIVGEEREGSPVYKQAHSRGMPRVENHLLYRLEKLSVLHIPSFPPGVERIGLSQTGST